MTDNLRLRRVLIRLPNWIGDGVMALPAVNAVKLSHPDWEVTCLGKRSVIALYEYNHSVDRLIEFRLTDGRNKLSALREFARGLREFKFDIGVALPGSFSSALVLSLAGISRRFGYRSELRSFLLTDPIKPVDSIHRCDRYLRLVGQAVGFVDAPRDMSLAVSAKETSLANSLLEGSGRLAAVCPTSRAPSRRWGASKYTELIRRLHREFGFSIALAGAPDESTTIEEIGRSAGAPFINLAEQNNVLLSVEVMRRAQVFVGNDSGAAHLAAAAGTRVVSISGADDPNETRPLARVSLIVNKHIECSPCVKNICPRKERINLCMHEISVDDVLRAVTEILKHD